MLVKCASVVTVIVVVTKRHRRVNTLIINNFSVKCKIQMYFNAWKFFSWRYLYFCNNILEMIIVCKILTVSTLVLNIFTFLYSYMVEKVPLSKIFELEILMDLHVLRSPQSEKHIFSKWSVCMCVCVYVCVCVFVCVSVCVCLLSA